MAVAEFPNFVGPTYNLPVTVADAERCVNWMPESLQSGGNRPTKQLILVPTPGVTEFCSIPLSPNRGAFEQDGRYFVVVGFGAYEVFSDGTRTQIGTLDADTNPATICSSGDGGNELMFTSAGKVYIYNLLSGAWSGAIGGLTAHFGGFLGGRFLALDTTTSTLRISDLYDGLTWDPLQFRQRSLASDRWKAMIVTKSLIWLIGSQTCEVWQNTGNFPFPFNPIPGMLYAVGIYAPYSANHFGENVGWVAGNAEGGGYVVMSAGGTPEIVSNRYVDWRIQSAIRAGDDLSDAVTMVYQENGHTAFVITFIEGDFTITYDLTTGMWHDRMFRDPNDSSALSVEHAWRPLYHAFAFGKHLVGDRSTGKIYRMGTDLFMDVGDAYIQRIRRTPHLNVNNQMVFYGMLEVLLNSGLGLANGQGSDPVVKMRFSDDGGNTWGNWLYESAGATGKYDDRVQWYRLGRARRRVFEIAVSDPVPWYILGANLDSRLGLS